jgi:hypothetical protein
MSRFAATITMPMTNADMQENSTRSITNPVICTLPGCTTLTQTLYLDLSLFTPGGAGIWAAQIIGHKLLDVALTCVNLAALLDPAA